MQAERESVYRKVATGCFRKRSTEADNARLIWFIESIENTISVHMDNILSNDKLPQATCHQEIE